MENIISMYFAICIAVWIVNVIAISAIICIKPLRMWLWKKYIDLSKEFAEICLAVWPELMGESSERSDEDEDL